MAYAMENVRKVKLFRNGRNQAVRIPREFELPGDEALLHKEGERLVIEPKPKKSSLRELLATWQAEDFPEIEDNLPPLDPIDL